MARGARAHDVSGEAAKLTFYLFLSSFPLLLVILAVTGLVGGEGAFEKIIAMVQTAAPNVAQDLIDGYVREITDSDRPGLLSVSLAATLWTASTAVTVLTRSLNTMYAVNEGRGWLRRRALALALVICCSVLIVTGSAALLFGVKILGWLGLPPSWSLIRWPVGLGGFCVAVWMLYNFLPNRDQRGRQREALMGAGAATVLWTGTTLGLQWVLSKFAGLGMTYGVITAVIALLLWLYLTVACILVGAELAVVLERRTAVRSGE